MSESSSKEFNADVSIQGMTCASCELLLERKLKTVPGVLAVSVSHKTGIATITADADHLPSEHQISSAIRKAGYSLADDDMPTVSSIPSDKQKWMEIGASLIIIIALYKFLQAFDLVSLAPSADGALSFGGIFLIGLVAGTSSCLAVTGGLLLAMAAKYNEVNHSRSSSEKFAPLLHFNIGRLVSYFVLGGLVGLLGQSITLSTEMTGYMNIVIAFVMLWIALTILQIVPKGSMPIQPPKWLSRKVAALTESKHPAAPFLLGAGTFFLPCGFTQSLQLVALASGSFGHGALTMFVFALGTLPSLLGISAVSASAKGRTSQLFLRFAGTLVFILALFNFRSGIALTGVPVDALFKNTPSAATDTAPTMVGSLQTIAMAVSPSGYEPSQLTIKAGAPVRWNIDATKAAGCTSSLVVPSLGIKKSLQLGMNEIDFTAPSKPGLVAFSCSMGMIRGSFNVQ